MSLPLLDQRASRLSMWSCSRGCSVQFRSRGPVRCRVSWIHTACSCNPLHQLDGPNSLPLPVVRFWSGAWPSLPPYWIKGEDAPGKGDRKCGKGDSLESLLRPFHFREWQVYWPTARAVLRPSVYAETVNSITGAMSAIERLAEQLRPLLPLTRERLP